MKKHLKTIEDFHKALNFCQDCVKDMITEDFTEEEGIAYLHGEYDEVILCLTTVKMRELYTFSDDIKDQIGRDDDLFR